MNLFPRMIGKTLGYDVTGKFDSCDPSSVGKARWKIIDKKSKGVGERLYVDIISIKGNGIGGAIFWTLIVNSYSCYCWSYYSKKKDTLAIKVLDIINKSIN
jgi:hypothetical protein